MISLNNNLLKHFQGIMIFGFDTSTNVELEQPWSKTWEEPSDMRNQDTNFQAFLCHNWSIN